MREPILGYGLCRCGCGQQTAISEYSAARDGYVRGEPRPYVFGHNRIRGPVAFWANMPMGLPDTECWEWRGSADKHGYGYFHALGEKSQIVPRIIYEHVNGPFPDDLSVLHSCDNPPCVNPAHLFLGTQKDNMRDMWTKGRAPWQNNGRASLEASAWWTSQRERAA